MQNLEPNINELIAALQPLVDRMRTTDSAVKVHGQVRWRRNEPLTAERMHEHLSGDVARGCCPIAQGASTTRIAALDLDSHKGDISWDEMCRVAGQISREAHQRGLMPIAFRSSGGQGVHLFFIWQEQQDAFSVRQALSDLLESCGLANGTAGVKEGQVEIFPKQDRVDPESLGSMILLPLHGKSAPMLDDLGVGYELGTRADVLTMEWPLSSDVEHREAPQSFGLVDTSVAHMSAEDARDALMAIPNDELLSACDDRDTWFRILCAAKAAGVSLEDAMHWCALHPSHNEAHFKKTWVSIRSGREGATPAAYLFAVANQYGFDRHIVANFETLDTVEDALEVFGNAPAGQKIQSKKFKLTPVPLLPNAAYVRDKDGFRIATAPNLRKAVGNNSTVQADLAYDVFTDELIIAPFSTNAAGEDICTGDWRPLRDEDLTEFRIQLELQGFKPVPKELMGDIVKLVCWQKQIDTAQIWLDGLSWDGIPRIDRFMADYMRTSDTAYATALSQYLWTAMAARIASPGCQADIVPVLVGAQGAGKSRALQAMAPHLDHYAEISLAERDDNLSRMLRGCLVAEIPELKGLHSRESEAIKAFLTKTHERWTPKYREFTTTFPRRCIFFGTTNEREFLSDITGNRRWAPIEVATRGAIERELIREDRDQLWAEAYARFQAGGIEWVDVERLAQVEHEAYMMTDEWEGFVSDWLTIPDPLTGIAPGSDPEGFTGADVLTQAIRVQTHQINRASEMRIARVLSGLGFKKKQVQKGGERRYRYYKK